MHSDFFPVSQNVPEDLLVVKDQPSNINKHIYELSLSLFDRCNLKCSFCFQNPHRDRGIRDFDRDYILSIPENTVPYVLGQLEKFETRTLYIRIWGGELFNDAYSDVEFQTYSEMCAKFVKMIPEYIKVSFNFMTNGIWIKNRDRIIALARKFGGTVGFSYDPVGRYSTEGQRKLAIENINYVLDELGYVNLAITATKPNIECILKGQDEFVKNMSPRIAVELNSYIPNWDYEVNMPTEELIFELYKHIIDNGMFMVNVTTQYLLAAFNMSPIRVSVCDCKASVQYSDNKLVSDCVEKSSCFGIDRFYGKFTKDRNLENCHDIKMNLAIQKRNCMMCRFFDRCPGFCTASILFDKYQHGECPIKRLMEYMIQNKDVVLEKFRKYREHNILPHEMQA